MALDETGLLVKLEANVAKWEKDFNRAIVQQQRASQRMERLAKQNAAKIASEYEGIGGRIGKAFNGIPASLKSLGGAFLGGVAGGVAVGGFDAIINSAKQSAKEIASFRNEAEKAGVSVETWQEWKYVADQNRVSIDAVTDGIKELHIRSGEFFTYGTGAGADAFKKLGYSAEELKTKLKDPSALMTEIFGKLKNLDQAQRSFLLEEIFGGAGEQFGTLVNQGGDALRQTIQTAHDVGAVMDSELIDKAAEVDREFTRITTSASNFGKRVVVEIAHGVVALNDFKESLATLFPDEAQGRQVLGDGLYDSLASDSAVVEASAEVLRDLNSEYLALADAAAAAVPHLIENATVLRDMGQTDAADALENAAYEAEGLANAFRDGTMSGEDFIGKLGEVQHEADAAFASVSDVDRVQFGGVIGELGRLGGAIAGVISLAQSLGGALASASGAKQVQTLRDRHAAEAASMDSLNAMRDANDNFTASEAARNAMTSESLKLEREKEAARKRATDAGATLTDAQITSAAQAALEAEAARAAADAAARSSGGSGGRSGGSGGGSAGGAEKLDEFAREAEAIKQRTMALQTEATVLATVALSGQQYGDAMEYAATKASLLTAAQEAGKKITPELEAQIDQLARGYVNAGEKAEEAARKVKDADSKTEKGANALTDLFSAGMQGSEAFGNALRNLAAELLKSQVLKLLLSFGKSGAPGSGIVGAIGGALGGFASGGYTGDGPKYEIAGAVHRGEFVFSKETVQRIGADRLEQLHSAAKSGARGYSSGGLVGSTAKLSRASSAPSRLPTGTTQNINLAPVINVNASGGTPEANADLAKQISNETERAMRGLIRDELVRQGRAGGMLSR